MSLQGAVDIAHRHVEQRCPRSIDIGAQLLRHRAEGRVQAGQFGALSNGGKKLVGDLGQARGVARGFVLNPELEATTGTDTRNGRRRNRNHHA